MFYFKGNVTGTVTSQQFNLPMVIKSFLLVNKSGGSNTVNVKVINDGSINIVPNNLTLAAGDMVDSDHELIMYQLLQIEVTSTGSLDYYFVLDNAPDIAITPP